MTTHESTKTISGRYRIEHARMRTPAGVLYEAVELTSKRDVAVEVASALVGEDARLRFERDAMSAQRLDGEHILAVLDVGTLPDGVPFVVREPCVASIATELRSRGHVAVDMAVAWTLEVAEAVAEAHALGMAHGDIRPETVMLARGDAGTLIAKLVWTSAVKAERLAREDVQGDINGLANLLHVLVAGKLDAENQADRASTLPTPIVHALASATMGKYRNVGELARALAPYAPFGHESARNVSFLLSRAGLASAREEPPPPSSKQKPMTEDWFDATPPPPSAAMDALPMRGRGVGFTIVALGLIGAAAVVTGLLFTRGELPEWSGVAEDGTAMTYLTSADLEGASTTSLVADEVTDDAILSRSLRHGEETILSLAPIRTLNVLELPDSARPHPAPAAVEVPSPKVPETVDDNNPNPEPMPPPFIPVPEATDPPE